MDGGDWILRMRSWVLGKAKSRIRLGGWVGRSGVRRKFGGFLSCERGIDD